MVLAGLIAMTNVMVLESSTMPIGGLSPVSQDSPFEVPVPASRGNNSDGDNYVDLYRDVNGDPIFQIDNAAPGVNDVYIGEPNVELDIAILHQPRYGHLRAIAGRMQAAISVGIPTL
jgi:hypothetical protein